MKAGNMLGRMFVRAILMAFFFKAGQSFATELHSEFTRTLGDTAHWVHFDVMAQERCEKICLACIGEGGENCEEDLRFRFCCHRAGGRPDGCGCREGL